MEALQWISKLIAVLFFLCYFYQFLYIPISWRRQKEKPLISRCNQYAVLICARNEEAVIGDLLDSIKAQTYPGALIHPFVMADNCTDNTAAIAAAHGATVYHRTNRALVGKGYALEALLNAICNDYPSGFDGYFVFDADNLLSPDYIERMHETFSQGYEIVTSYRNSKNYSDNWISAGYALWFLRESQYLNRARMKLGTSCAVSGTGFLFSRGILEELGGWPFHLLTEDIEFSVHEILQGKKIGYCEKAMFYDEQPTDFRQSWRQRTRWSKGYLQVFGKYGAGLLRGISRGSFAAFDMSMNIMPAFFLSAAGLLIESVIIILSILHGGIAAAIPSLLRIFGSMYGTLFVLGAITTATEWSRIHATAAEKVKAVLTFPIFMFTYLPIAISAIFAKAEWKPIVHSVRAKDMRERAA